VFSRIIWYAGPLLQVLILFRALRSRTLLKYPFFYTYVTSVCVTTILLSVVWWNRNVGAYQRAYWIVQFCTLMIGCGIVLEIFKHALRPYPGADKFATVIALGTFAAIFSFALLYQVAAPNWSGLTRMFELERDVRTVQAVFLFLTLAVIFYYRLPIGENLKGMIAGYGLYIVTSLLTLATRAYAGPKFNGFWNVIQPLSFDVSLTVWLVALWSFHPNPAPDPTIPLEADYEVLAARTRRALASMRSHLTRTARP
jgi:hypothetical protein